MIATRWDDVVQNLKAEAKARQSAAGGLRATPAGPLVATRTQALQPPVSGKGKRNPSTRDQLAKIAHVSTRKIRQAEQVNRSPKRQELEPQVLAGSKTLAQAVKEAAPATAPRLFDIEGEARRHVELIELSFERCPAGLREQYKDLVQK